jgi:hypothetical protein
MSLRFPVRDCAFPASADFNPDAEYDVLKLDSFINKSVARVTDALKAESHKFSEDQRGHLSQIFFSMRQTHLAIRSLLEHEDKDPRSASAMPLVRIQLETLFGVCLIVERPDALSVYLKDGWKKVFVRNLLLKQECSGLKNLSEALDEQDRYLEGMRVLAGVTNEEKLTIEADELGVPVPQGFERKPIRGFPTPAEVLESIQDDSCRKMLCRLYPEYELLCSFVHLSPHSRAFPAIFDQRQKFGEMFTTKQREEMFQKEIARPALWNDFISIVQSCAEFVSVYPGDMDLAATVTEAWKVVLGHTLIGNAIWQLRTKGLLGALG